MRSLCPTNADRLERTMLAGLTIRSKSSAPIAPESRAASRRGRPLQSASWAMADALS
jgi:hypothetical protein